MSIYSRCFLGRTSKHFDVVVPSHKKNEILLLNNDLPISFVGRTTYGIAEDRLS